MSELESKPLKDLDFGFDELANQLLRMFNCIIDSVIIYGIFIIFDEVVNVLIIFFGYYFLMEFLLGKTIGKFITQTTVVLESGKSLDIISSISRTVCRFIPFDFFSFFLNNYGYGWHDKFSNTILVKDSLLREKRENRK